MSSPGEASRTAPTTDLTADERGEWEERGYILLSGFAEGAQAQALVERVVEIARDIDAGTERAGLLLTPEKLLADAPTPEERLAKIFRIARSEPLFGAVAADPRIVDRVAELVGGDGRDVDCFLSQFIFKHPGALGQPWHQDQYYFGLQPAPQCGAWLACSAATIDNGPLWVVPGSHTEPIHRDVEWDEREGAGDFYVEIQGVDTSREVPVLMDAGDLLLFHSHLRHRSTDNGSDVMRAAMVYHYADAASEGPRPGNNDWIPVRRDGETLG